MTIVSAPQQAKRLRAECAELERVIAQLKRLKADAETLRSSHDRARYERLMFNVDRNLYAGLCALYGRTDPETMRMINVRYQSDLEDLHPTTAPYQQRPIDYAALLPDARPYLLGPYLGLSFGQAYPRLCLTRSNPAAGRLVYISPNGPSDLDAWRPHLTAIREWLGGAWDITDHTVSAIVLERRTPLPSIIPLDPRAMRKGQLYFGVDVEKRQHVSVPFADLTAGLFIPGGTGTGKSNALHVLLRSILTNLPLFSAVYLVDGKDGITMHRYGASAPGKVHVLWEERDLWQLTQDLVAFMRARTVHQRRHNVESATSGFVALIIDEMATYTQRPSADPKHPDNKRHTAFIDDLTLLARRGRSAGIRLFITAQQPVSDQIPPTLRANCLTTLAFQLTVDAHATAVFGQLEGLPADPRQMPRGRALFKNGLTGDLKLLQIPVLEQRR